MVESRLGAYALVFVVACAPKTITLLHTTDVHANVAAWDYLSDSADPKRGLAKAMTLIRQHRTPCTLVIDTGDAIQGAPLGPQAMAAAMNVVGYDAMALGNHDFDFGPAVLRQFVADANFPVLAGNVTGFNAYVIKDVCGVKVGILGLVTPKVEVWARPEHIAGLRFYSALETARAQVPNMLASGAEIVVVAIHAGPNDDGLPGENEAGAIAREVAGVDVILSGHTHAMIPKLVINGVLISQPHRWASHVGETTIVWRRGIAAKDSRLIAVDDVPEDAKMMAAIAPFHSRTRAAMDAPMGQATGAFEGGDKARFSDSPLSDLINAAQSEAAARAGFAVDASAAAIVSDKGRLPKGALSLRDVYSVYVYDNTLWVIEVSRDVLKQALEHDARYFNTVSKPPADRQAVKAPGNNLDWDIYSGVTYEVDLAKPVGQRVTLQAPASVRLALNNYRASGGGGYDMFKQGKVLWRSQDTVRDMLIAYVRSHSPISPVVTRNFTLRPDLNAIYFPER